MWQRLTLGSLSLAIFLGSFSSTGWSQTVRFTTNVGSFDMVLNPTADPNLQPLVDNLIAYVGLGRYHYSAINRAADGTAGDSSDDFVLQMGGFLGFQPTPELWPTLASSVESFAPVEVDSNGDGQVDFSTLTNSRGTVSLALSAGNPNSGTSSFFVNLGDNASLDSQGFVPFAEIEDMTTIDRILALDQVDLSGAFGQPGNLAFIDVPVTDDGRLVVVMDVEVVDADDDFSFVGPIATALQIAQRGSSFAASSVASSALLSDPGSLLSDPGAISFSPLASTMVPEPAVFSLACASVVAAFGRRRRRGWRQRS